VHLGSAPSVWVQRFAAMVPEGAPVLDLACGGGRHTRLFAEAGHPVTAVDIDMDRLGDLGADPRVEAIQVDLEGGDPAFPAGPLAGPFAGRTFGAVVVTNYLHRPLLESLVAALDPGGVLIYETFAVGNEELGGRVTNPNFLLRHGELLELARGRLRVIAYEEVTVAEPMPAAVQRICAIRTR
jgi:SAM-dependent methyltransferase